MFITILYNLGPVLVILQNMFSEHSKVTLPNLKMNMLQEIIPESSLAMFGSGLEVASSFCLLTEYHLHAGNGHVTTLCEVDIWGLFSCLNPKTQRMCLYEFVGRFWDVEFNTLKIICSQACPSIYIES